MFFVVLGLVQASYGTPKCTTTKMTNKGTKTDKEEIDQNLCFTM